MGRESKRKGGLLLLHSPPYEIQKLRSEKPARSLEIGLQEKREGKIDG